jgi:hypothetical protein
MPSYFYAKREFYILAAFALYPSLMLGLRNSYYRLEGLVPNGLPGYKSKEPVKYDYTSHFLEKSKLFSLFISKQKK